MRSEPEGIRRRAPAPPKLVQRSRNAFKGSSEPVRADRIELAGQPPKTGGGARRRTIMATPSKKEIAARAYKLWEQNGQPEGREDEFWHLAEQELLNEDESSPLRTPDNL
jgi:hypothetical protein